jgi:acetyl esterase/lipase
VRFPRPVEDVVCAADFAAARAAAEGFEVGPVVLVGHSAGAHLAALAALEPGRFRDGCPHPAAEPDGLVGLAGPYDVSLSPDIAEPLFGAEPADEPDRWIEGNPVTWVGSRPAMPAYLVHGEEDRTVPISLTESFAAELRDAGHPVEVSLMRGVDHGSIYSAEVIAEPLAAWIAGIRTHHG